MQKLPKLSDQERPECKISVEAISKVAEEIASLSIHNYEETGIDPNIGYHPNWDQYLEYELTDNVRVITARYNNVLVGYAIYLIGPFKHNKEVMYADLDTIYINEVFRSPFLAIKMLKAGEEAVKDKAQYIMATSTNRKPIDKLLGYMKYKPVETIFWKKIEANNGK